MSIHSDGRLTAALCRELGRDEVLYYDLFQHQVALDLASHAHSDFWCRVVPLQCARDEAVLEAVLALGALSRALYMSGDMQGATSACGGLPMPLHPSKEYRLDEHYTAALRFQMQASKRFRKRMSATQDEEWLRSATIITLLLIGFELLQGKIKVADSIMRNGLMLTRSLSEAASEKSSSMPDNEIPSVYLQSLSIMSVYTHFCKSQPNLYQPGHDLAPPLTPPNPQDSLSTLGSMWRQTFLQVISFITHSLKGYIVSKADWAMSKKRQLELLADLQRWRDAMHVRENHDDGLEANMIRIQILTSTVIVGSCLNSAELAYDGFLPEFRLLVAECSLYMTKASQEKRQVSFAFNGGDLASAISLVASKCRHRGIRMQAVELFKNFSWREGPWDRRAVICNMGQVALEEAARVADWGVVPASSRWVWTNAFWEPSSDYVSAEYTKVIPEADGSFLKRHVDLSIHSWPVIPCPWTNE